MGYIKFASKHLDDDQWLDLSPAAFVVHTWALSYCNEQATDGRISKARAGRLNCPVTPSQLSKAWQQLVHFGVWSDDGDEYVCPMFLDHGISAEEQNKTREKWAQDARRQRLHRLGNHELCTPKSCPATKNPPVESTSRPPVDTPTLDKTRPDQTRPDPTLRGGEGRRGDGRPPSAGAPDDAAAQVGKHHPGPGCCALSDQPTNRRHYQPGECPGCDDEHHERQP